MKRKNTFICILRKISKKEQLVLSKLCLACVSFLISTNIALANPIGGQVTAGNAIISSPDATTTQIHQTTDKAIIEWHSFNIAPNEHTHFQQPSAQSITLNRINPAQGVSQIFGSLSANGRIILINQAGIYFGPTAHVNVGSIIASTTDISNANFAADNYIFDQPTATAGSIINQGTIKAGEAGLVALIGSNVQNDGLIVAHLGNVVLASGNTFTFDFAGDQLINFAVDEGSSAAGATVGNTGKIIANGGKIIMTGKTASNVLNGSINMSGVMIAKSVSQKNGEIILSSENGTVNVTGKIIASGKKGNGNGGKIKILAKNVIVNENAKIDASGNTGGGEILIGGDYQGKNSAIFNAQNTFVGQNVTINADAIASGNGGKIIVWADNNTFFHGAISAKGGEIAGDGGLIETSGKAYLDVAGSTVNASASHGKSGMWLLDPFNVIIDNAATTCTSPPCFSGGNPTIYTPDTNTSHVSVANILTALSGGTSVTITTGTFGAQTGTIAVNAAINKTSGSTPVTLTLDSTNAGGTITVSNPISSTVGALSVSLLSGNAITLNSTITTNGGNFIATAQNAITFGNGAGTTPGVVTAGSGTVSINANQDGAGAQGFTMNLNSNITTTNSTASAVSITSPTSGTGPAALRDITTGTGGTITVNVGGDVTQTSGTLNTGNSGTVTLTNPNIAGRNIGAAATPMQIIAGTLNLTTGSGGGFVTNTGTSSLDLKNITTPGALTITSTGSSSITNSGTLAITGTTTISAGAAQDITLNSSSNDFSTIAISSGNNVTLQDTNSLIFSISTVSGNLNVTTNGDITDSAALSVSGTSTFNAGAANSITLDTATNNFNIVAISNTNNVTLRDANAIVFGNISLAGNLTLTAAGAVTQDIGTAILVNGSSKVTTLTAGAANNITLTNTANDFSTVVISTGNNVALTDTNALEFGASTSAISGTLDVITGGNLTQLAGALTVTGLATFTAGTSNDIILSNSNNNFSTIKIVSANNATLRDTNALVIDTSTIQNTLTLTAGNSLTQSGAITVPTLIASTRNNAAVSLTLDSLSNHINTVTLQTLNAAGTANSAGVITFKNADAFDIATIGTTSTINLTSLGSISDSGNITGSTLTTNSVGGTVLDFGSNLTGFNATNTSTGNITLVNTGTFSITGLSQSGNGAVNITNTGSLALTGGFNTNSGSGAVNLSASTTMTLSNTLNAGSGTVTLNANQASGGSAFTMNAGGSISTSNSGSSAVAINVNTASGGTGTAALRDITTGNGGTITVKTDNGNNTTGGDITQASGTLDSGTSGSIVLTTPNQAADNIGTTALPIQIITGTLSASSGNSGIFVTNNASSALTVLTLAAFRSDTLVTGNAQIISNGIIQQTGLSNPITAATLTLKTLNNAGADITFNNSNNVATNANLSARDAADTANSAGNISYYNLGTLNMTGINTAGNANITTTNILTDSGSLNISGTLTVTAANGITLNNTNAISAFHATNTTSGNITFSNNTVPVSITGITQSGSGTLTLSNTTDMTIATGANLTTNGGTAAFTVTNGTFAMDNGASISTNNANITLNTTDINLDANSSINSGNGNVSITQNTAGGSIHVGNTTGTMTLTGTELQTITANALDIIAPNNGQIVVDGISSANTQNIASTITLTATAGTLGNIAFQNTPSSFKAFTANADDGISIGSGALLTTTVGNLSLNGDAGGGVGTDDSVTLNANLTAAGNITLSATNGGILLGQSVVLTGNNITFNSVINGNHNLTLDAGATGNITFNANVGNVNRIGTLTVINVNTLTNNALINAQAYVQNDGNDVQLGTAGLDLTGNATVTGTTIDGAVNVAGLTLNVDFANLTGFVDGAFGQAAINKIILVNTITPGTHFFDGIDMYRAPTPPPPPNIIDVLAGSIPQIVFSYSYQDQHLNATLLSSISEDPVLSNTQILELLSELDAGKKQCVNIGITTICSF